MSNVLKVSHQEAIRSLHEKGWSQRRIARELGVNGRTVRRYIRGQSKCSISTPGSESMVGREPTVWVADHLGRKSRCEPFEVAIDSKMGAGLSAQRIYQDLVEEKGFLGSYQSVKRFVRRLRQRQPERVWRIECQPGEEMQVDFGLGAPIEHDDGKIRRSWVLRAVLSYSRKGYSEAVMRQDTESLLRCLENSLRHFGGVPLLLNLDNLKAAVLKADWFDPQINPKLADFAAITISTSCPVVRGRLNTKGRWSAPCLTFAATRSKGDVSSRWPKKTLFLVNGKRTWPTNAFTARPANRSRHALKRNAPICNPCHPRFFPATRRPGAR